MDKKHHGDGYNDDNYHNYYDGDGQVNVIGVIMTTINFIYINVIVINVIITFITITLINSTTVTDTNYHNFITSTYYHYHISFSLT